MESTCACGARSAELFMEQLSEGLTRTENVISYFSQIPVLGTATGVTKVAMGVLQTIAATAGAVIGIFARIFDNKKIFAYALDHLENGLGNIVAGTFEAIPLIGTALWYARRGLCRDQIKEMYTPQRNSPSPAAGATSSQKGAIAEERLDALTNEIFNNFRMIMDSTLIKYQTYSVHPDQPVAAASL